MDEAAVDDAAVDEIVARCARLPLALALAAARATVDARLPLARLAADLRERGPVLDTLAVAGPDIDVRAVFSWSYRALGEPAAALFRLLGPAPGADVDRFAAASLAGLPVERVDAVLAELVRAHLMSEPAPGRYAMHDLLRAYAAELAVRDDGEAARDAAALRLLDHYLDSAGIAGRHLDPHRPPARPGAVAPGAVAAPVDGIAGALRWLDDRLPALLSAAAAAVDTGRYRHATGLAWALATYLSRRARWLDLAAVESLALTAATRLGDLGEQARAHRGVARASARLGRHRAAEEHYRCAMRKYAKVGDVDGQAMASLNLGGLAEQQGRYRDALRLCDEAVALLAGSGDLATRARVHNAAGWCHALLGELDDALADCRRALALCRAVGDRTGMAATWDSLGYINHRMTRYRPAAACYRRAVRINRDLGDRHYEADTLTRLADSHEAAGDQAAAAAARHRAAELRAQLAPAPANR